MKIQNIYAYQVDLPMKEASLQWAGGRGVTELDSTYIRIVTDSGIEGYGEVCPLGSSYLPSYAAGVRAGLKELGPELIGCDPLELQVLNDKMDYCLKGHPYVKCAIDVACWDILGKFTKLPVCTLLGGRYGNSISLYQTISQVPPKAMRENVLKYKSEGYKQFNLKLGGNPDEDIQRIKLCRQAIDDWDVLVCDANTGWLPHQAIRIAHAVDDLDVYIEQPCVTYEECLNVRAHTQKPFILDENIDGVQALLRANQDHACDVVNLKISKQGGLTRTKQMQDLCVSMGMAMTIEDTWGSDVVTATIAHLAQSTPEQFRFTSTAFNSYCNITTARGAPHQVNGQMSASEKPGLGVEPIMEVLGDPVITI